MEKSCILAVFWFGILTVYQLDEPWPWDHYSGNWVSSDKAFVQQWVVANTFVKKLDSFHCI